MSPPDEAAAGPGTTENGRQFQIQKIYIKDVSFEAPNSPEIFTVPWQPNVEVNLENTAKQLDPTHFEVAISMTVTVTVGEQTPFLVEIVQGGLFQIDGFTDEELKDLLGRSCPGILFPYVRESISDLVIRGGFPQMLLAPVNFDVLYEKHLAEQSAASDRLN